MHRQDYNICSLSGNTLKIIAALSMLIDHIGYMLFPSVGILRIIGRLSFPLFAFMISQGCIYTKNKSLYFIRIFLLASFFQLPYFFVKKDLYWGILFTFSFSVIAVYSLLLFRNCVKPINKILSAFVFIFVIASIYILNCLFKIDYGFWGCMLPVFAAVFNKQLYNTVSFSVGLIILSVSLGGIQPYCLLALPFLFLYSGKRGEANMKYFFYIFYPLHLAILYGINIIFFS